MENNPVGLEGLEFLEYVGPQEDHFESLFARLGLSEVAHQKDKKISLFRQGDVNFLLNRSGQGFAHGFSSEHGPSICSTGFRVKDSEKAFRVAVERGAKPYDGPEESKSLDYPAIYGIGDSLVYFVDDWKSEEGTSTSTYVNQGFEFFPGDPKPKGHGFLFVDHMTNNVPKGELDKWADFYTDIFNFREIRFFDIKGDQTGLLSRAMRSPCNGITIPINEPTEDKSQIQEYIDEYKGSGIQHVALATDDICNAVAKSKGDILQFLKIPDTYYEVLKDRVPLITENLSDLKELEILADGDEEGYLLQIFTQNVIGPIFFEFIQRKNHHGFGEGNFQALFEAIERDQRRRGVL